MLWAGVLFIWELVGIDLEKAKEAGGNFGAFIGAIKSPQAVPWALLILVGYFLFKVTIEWQQCDVARRKVRVARIDFVSGWVVSIIAFALYYIQAINRVQFADLILDKAARYSWLTGIPVGVLLALVGWYWMQPRPIQKRRQAIFRRAIAICCVVSILAAILSRIVAGYPARVPFFLIGALSGFLPFSIPAFSGLLRLLRSAKP